MIPISALAISIIGRLDKAEDDVFDVFADISRFREGGRIGDRKGHIEDARKGAGEEGFPRACGAEEHDVGFAVLDFPFGADRADPLIVVVDGDRDGLFRSILADHIFVEPFFDLFWLEDLDFARGRFFLDDVDAEVNTFVANERFGARDELFYGIFRAPAKGAGCDFLFFLSHV